MNPSHPDRRGFVSMLGALAAATALGSSAAARPRAKVEFKLSLAEWSLHNALQKGQLDHLDFPRASKRDYGIDTVEYVNTFFAKGATDFGYLGELKKRCADEGVQSRLIMCDGEGSLGAADEAERRKAVENHFKWLAAAAYLGCMAIRVNAAGSGPREEHAKHAADSLHRLCEIAAPYGLFVIVENHGGPSSDGAWLAGVMKLADSDRVGTLPDFGNFNLGDGKSYDRYKGVQELMPWAKAVSAKSYDFDAQGNETTIDYARMMKIVLAAGYHDCMGIEYEGERLSEPEGIRATKKLLERLREELS